MLPLDCHAHIEPDINPEALEQLQACVVAVSRTLNEYAQVVQRNDRSTVWGLGAHPGVLAVHKDFDLKWFRILLEKASIIGEIGLDSNSKVDLDVQRRTLHQIIACLTECPRVASIHSGGATREVLDIIEKYAPVGVVLHWWRGTEQQTVRAIQLGCYFSINVAEIATPKVLHLLPRDRILTETDHPFGDRRQSAPRRPGNVIRIEQALAQNWTADVKEVRRQIWANFCRIATQTSTAHLFPLAFQQNMLAV